MALVPITPIFLLGLKSLINLITGSITLKIGILLEFLVTLLSAKEDAELQAITIILHFLLIKNCIIFLLKLCMAFLDFSPY